MDASAVERSRVGGWWARRMGIRSNYYLAVYNPPESIERVGHHHDSPGLSRGIYRRRRYCDLY